MAGDIDGTEAFGMVLEQLVDAGKENARIADKKHAAEHERDIARRELAELQTAFTLLDALREALKLAADPFDEIPF